MLGSLLQTIQFLVLIMSFSCLRSRDSGGQMSLQKPSVMELKCFQAASGLRAFQSLVLVASSPCPGDHVGA